MRSSITALTLAHTLALAAAAIVPAGAAHAAVQDFRLPSQNQPAPPSQTRQGPIAPDLPESRNVRTTPTPTAEPERAPSATPSPAPAPAIVVPTVPVETPAAVPRAAPATRAAATPAALSAATPSPLPAEAAPTDLPSAPPSVAFDTLPVTAAPTAPALAGAENESGFPWLWAIGGGLLAALAGAGGWLLLRRPSRPGPAAKAPTIERPRVEPPAPAPAPTPPAPTPPLPAAPVAASAQPLQLTLEPLRLSLTLMNAALAYRLEVTNPGNTALTDLRIDADMISAHASLTREAQLAGPDHGATARHAITRLEPGATHVVEGEFRLPFPQIVPIRQGDAALLLPLARFRATADDATPVVRTFAVGQAGDQPDAALQPFRLDQGPRVYPQLAQRAFV